MISWPINHFRCGGSHKWPQMSRDFILALPDGWISCEETHFENNMHKFGGYLDDVSPILAHLHAIPQDKLLLVLCFFCFEAFDDPIEALHYNFELDQFIARDDFPSLVWYPLHLEKVFSAHVTLDFVVDFIWQLINEFVLCCCCQCGCLDAFDGKVLT